MASDSYSSDIWGGGFICEPPLHLFKEPQLLNADSLWNVNGGNEAVFVKDVVLWTDSQG